MTTEEFEVLMIKWGNFKAKCKSKFARTEFAKKNEELHNKYKKRRCFIVGNGASIGDQNLSLLADEIVFVTNEFWRMSNYNVVKPDYWVIVDPVYFCPEYKEILLGGINSISELETKPAFFVPYYAQGIIHESYGWDEWTSVYYIDAVMSFVDGYSDEYNIAKPVPGTQCVVQTAMLLATYMGFEEIYLLGVEQTNVIDTIEAYLGKKMSRYVYDIDKEVQKYITMNSLEQMLKGYANIFHLYKEIYKFAQNRGVEIFNCTTVSLIDSIPYRDYYSLF